MTATANELDELLLAPEFMDNPYPTYHVLRDADPIHWCEPWHCWVVTRYEDVAATFRDPRNFLNGGRFASLIADLPDDVRQQISPLENHFRYGIIGADPPDHTRLRTLLNKAFTPRAVAELRGAVQNIVNQHFDAVQERGEMDVVQDLAYPLPVIVIAQMLGVPPDERDQFKTWSNDILAFQSSGRTTPEIILHSQRALLEMRAYMRALANERLKEPRNDLLSALVAAEEQGDKLTEDELLATCVTLLVAGHETTTNLIANGVLALLQHPDHMQQLRRDPSLMESAVEEFLRYDSPLQRNRRVVARDLEYGGKQMQQGQLVLQILGAANRDPAQFPQPDTLDLRRTPNRHIAFGFGIHFCLGAPLARLEAPIAIGTMLQRLPNLELATDSVRWRHEQGVLRGLHELPVTFTA